MQRSDTMKSYTIAAYSKGFKHTKRLLEEIVVRKEKLELYAVDWI